MALLIRYECPQCKQKLPLDLQDFAPGHRQVCTTCQVPARVTKAGLELFSEDLRLYCQS